MHCKQLQRFSLQCKSESFYFSFICFTPQIVIWYGFVSSAYMRRMWPGKAKFRDHAAHKSESTSVFEWVLEKVKYGVA